MCKSFTPNSATTTSTPASSCRVCGRWQHKLRALWNNRNNLQISVVTTCAWPLTLQSSAFCLTSRVMSFLPLTQKPGSVFRISQFDFVMETQHVSCRAEFLHIYIDLSLPKVKRNNIQLFFSIGTLFTTILFPSMCCHLPSVSITVYVTVFPHCRIDGRNVCTETSGTISFQNGFCNKIGRFCSYPPIPI
jgi:hypothetical protein